MTVRILVVEDSDALRDWMTRVLQRSEYAVTQAASGEEALALLRQTGEYREPFDVVISDIIMGEVDGVAVTQAARNQSEPPEVILLTSHGSLDTAATALRLGAFDYLQRPVQQSLLIARVQAAAERRAERLRQAGEAAAWRAVAEVVGKVQPSDSAAGLAVVETKVVRYRTIGQLQIDTQRRELWFDTQRIQVTPIEYTIISSLAEMPGSVMGYGDLVQRTHAIALSEREAYGLLRTHVRNLRHKIERSYIVSVRGVGYMLDASGEADTSEDAD